MNNLSRFTKMTAKEKRGTYQIKTIKETKEEIKFLCAELLIKTVLGAFAIGERLAAMKAQIQHGKFLSYLEKEFPFSRMTANNYMRLFEYFKDDPLALEGFGYREALIKAGIIKPKEAMADVEGYNRVDLGGDPGQLKFDFGELFELPAAANKSLQNYRTVGELVSEIIVVKRTEDGKLISKRFAHFSEDIPQDPMLKAAYREMSLSTQGAIENYLAVLERAEKK